MSLNRTFWVMARKARLFYLSTFKPEYLIEQIRLRKGSCPPSCGVCCSDKCEHKGKDNRCKDYENRPQRCRDAPMDRFDVLMLENVYGHRCFLYWD
jgi:hypothetical protein